MKRTAVITGILGQDGSLLAELLARKGYDVIGIARPNRTAPGNVRQSPARLVDLDIGDNLATRRWFAENRPDECYHLAAVHSSSERRIDGVDHDMIRTNLLSTYSIANAIATTVPDCRLLFAGTSQMYTPRGAVQVVSEDTVPEPSTFYGLTKMWGRVLVDFNRRAHGLWGCTAILFNHESPRRASSFVTRKITAAAARHKFGSRDMLQIQDVTSRIDWCSAQDAVAAMHLMLGADRPKDYVIASGLLHSVEDVLATAYARVGLDWKEHVRYVRSEGTPAPALVGDPQRIRRELGWSPMKSFGAMIEEMVDSDCDLMRARQPEGLGTGDAGSQGDRVRTRDLG